MKGRFAPSPTGYMHLGNLWIALLSYISTRQQNGEFILRIEDIDRQRSKTHYIEALVEDLEWLGFDWDIGPKVSKHESEYLQSSRQNIYESYLQKWIEAGEVYPCFCNRARLQAIASAPHLGDEKHLYDGSCRNLTAMDIKTLSNEKSPGLRLKLTEYKKTFYDLIKGPQNIHLQQNYDDIILKRGDGMFSYQLAVSVDDHLMGITEVIRGNDLLPSTGYQLYLLEKLNAKLPNYAHAALLLDNENRRLSKRQKGITIRELKENTWPNTKILAHLAHKCGLTSKKYQEITLRELLQIELSLAKLPRDSIILS